MKRFRQAYTPHDAAFTVKVDAWQPLMCGYSEVLGRSKLVGIDKLERERGFCAQERIIVFLSFENRLAPLGGLAAVMRFLPEYLKKGGEKNVILVTPHYANIPRVKAALDGGALESVLKKRKFRPHPTSSYEETVSCYRDTEALVDTYYVAVDGRFTASQNPYAYDDPNDLLDDALAFCAAVPHILARLGITKNILFHAQDWEAAPVAISAKLAMRDEVLSSARTALTLHNSFDSGIGGERKKRFWGDNIRGDTILQCTIPLLNGPLTTVSAPFARELRTDKLQSTVFTSHLQSVFAMNPPIGIENGMFGRPYLRYTYTALSRARQGEFAKLLYQKARFRERMFEVIGEMNHPDIIGGLREVSAHDTGTRSSADANDAGINDVNTRHIMQDDNVCNPAANIHTVYMERPILFMSGRLDLTQKGFDVIFHALTKFPAGKIGLIFCPSSADPKKHPRELAFFKDVAAKRPGDIVIWPFRVPAEDYTAVMSGSSFLLMPSFYEPFGAATEGFMHGTPVIARAAGGLLSQVKPYGMDEEATGFLYRERIDDNSWRDILAAPASERVKIPLYQSMVDEAYLALTAAAGVFADKQVYGRMVLNGMESLKSFTWGAAVKKYRRIYDTASNRGFIDT